MLKRMPRKIAGHSSDNILIIIYYCAYQTGVPNEGVGAFGFVVRSCSEVGKRFGT